MPNVHIATYQDAAAKLANTMPAFDEAVVIRLGGDKRYDDYPIQINSAQSIRNSINKLAQKNLLLQGGIATLPIYEGEPAKEAYPVVVKGVVRSCGIKVFVANNSKQWFDAVEKLNGGGYYAEPLFEATSEYRLHCSRKEVFFSVKKHKRNPADIIINHDNHYNTREFLKPRLWKEIQAECIKAMNVLDLDIACFDVLYSSKDNNKHIFVIAEANTNPELLNNTYNAYQEVLIRLIKEKIADRAAKLKDKPKAKKLTPEQQLKLVSLILEDLYEISDNGAYVNIKL